MNVSSRPLRWSALALAVVALVACGDKTPAPQASARPVPAPASVDASPAVAAPTAAPAGEAAAPEAPAGLARSLTFYSGDFESVAAGNAQAGWGWSEDTWSSPGTGARQISRHDLPLTVELSSVLLQAPSGGQVLGQRFVGGQDPQALRAMAVGKSVRLWVNDRPEPLEGRLVNAGPGSWILENGGQTTVVDNPLAWSADMGAGASARWEWDVDGTVSEPWKLAYGFTGVAWQADTVLTLNASPSGCQASWSTDALVANRTGQELAGNGLALLAGSPNRPSPVQPTYARMEMAVAAAAPMPAPAVPQATSEQYRYALAGAFRLPNGSVTRVPLARPANPVACERYYAIGQDPEQIAPPPRPIVFDGLGGPTKQTLPVRWGLEVANTQETGLGIPLPAGRVRVMEGSAWAGETRIEHTPVGADVRLDLGSPFDVTAERERTAFALDADRLGARETVTVVVKNAKDVPSTVRLFETFPRWRGWTLAESSQEPAQRYGQGVRFDVLVPAKGQTVVTYTVAYRWPASPL